MKRDPVSLLSLSDSKSARLSLPVIYSARESVHQSSSVQHQNQQHHHPYTSRASHQVLSTISSSHSKQHPNHSYQLATTSLHDSLLKKKSPSCKKIFGEVLTSKRIPISSLSVTKYADLLAIDDSDPRHPDISLHIPIDTPETRDQLRSLQLSSAPAPPTQQSQSNTTSKDNTTTSSHSNNYNSNSNKLPSVFMSFRSVKEINRNEFLRMHSDNPSFQSLDFHDLGSASSKNRDTSLITKNKRNKDENRIINESDETGDQDNSFNGGPHHSDDHNGSMMLKSISSNSGMNTRPLTKIELSLMHNKDIQAQMQRNLFRESQTSYEHVKKQVVKQEEIVKNMPKIRKYPIFKLKTTAVVAAAATVAGNENQQEENGTSGGAAADKKDEVALDGEKKVRFSKNQNAGVYPVYWYEFEQNQWKPDIRESQSLVIEGKSGFLFGGVGNQLYNGVTELDLENYRWKESKGEANVPSARFGHSCCVYKRSLVFFGGEYQSTQNNLKIKDCLFEVHLYNLDTRIWKFMPCSGGPLQARKNHTATVVGRNLLVSGGTNQKDQALRDLWFLDLGTQTWSEAEASADLEVSLHSCAAVYHSQRCGKVNLYKASDLKINKWGANIEQEGVYFFGGKGSRGEIYSDLRILRTDCKPMQWIRPETKGVQPKPRYGHTTTYSQELNMLVIHGGKNDNEDAVFFGDTFILNIDDLTWVQIVSYGKAAAPRSNHSAAIHETKLIIFGGLNLDGFLPPFVNVLELDSSVSRKMHDRDEAEAIMFQQQAYARSSQINLMASRKQQPPNIDNQPNTPLLKSIHKSGSIPSAISQQQKDLVNSLSFQNFKSFLPIPRLNAQAYGSSSNNSTTKTPQSRKNNIVSASSFLQRKPSKIASPTQSPRGRSPKQQF